MRSHHWRTRCQWTFFNIDAGGHQPFIVLQMSFFVGDALLHMPRSGGCAGCMPLRSDYLASWKRGMLLQAGKNNYRQSLWIKLDSDSSMGWKQVAGKLLFFTHFGLPQVRGERLGLPEVCWWIPNPPLLSDGPHLLGHAPSQMGHSYASGWWDLATGHRGAGEKAGRRRV